MSKSVWITDPVNYHHLSYCGVDIPRGTSLRTLLKLLRSVSWGNIGGTHAVRLSDGTEIAVELKRRSNGSCLMSSSAVRVRWSDDEEEYRIVRCYSVR
jgi:hypothetical protein